MSLHRVPGLGFPEAAGQETKHRKPPSRCSLAVDWEAMYFTLKYTHLRPSGQVHAASAVATRAVTFRLSPAQKDWTGMSGAAEGGLFEGFCGCFLFCFNCLN